MGPTLSPSIALEAPIFSSPVLPLGSLSATHSPGLAQKPESLPSALHLPLSTSLSPVSTPQGFRNPLSFSDLHFPPPLPPGHLPTFPVFSLSPSALSIACLTPVLLSLLPGRPFPLHNVSVSPPPHQPLPPTTLTGQLQQTSLSLAGPPIPSHSAHSLPPPGHGCRRVPASQPPQLCLSGTLPHPGHSDTPQPRPSPQSHPPWYPLPPQALVLPS